MADKPVQELGTYVDPHIRTLRIVFKHQHQDKLSNIQYDARVVDANASFEDEGRCLSITTKYPADMIDYMFEMGHVDPRVDAYVIT